MYKKSLKKYFLLILIIFFFSINIFSQQTNNNNSNNNNNNNKTETTKDFIPREYKDFKLGMDINSFKETISNSNYLYYEGEIPLTLGEQDKNIFKASAKPYILKILFYFYKEKLSMFTFYYNPKKISVYEKLKNLSSKYGEPQKIDNFRFFWEDSKTLMILQKDNILKVIDKAFILTLQQENKKIEEIENISKEQIFDNF